MARSQIIKDFVSEQVSLEIAIKRLIVLLDSLGSEELSRWAQNELTGYKNITELPPYRIVRGNFIGTYTVPGYGGYTRYQNSALATMVFTDEQLKEHSTMNIENSIGALESSKENGLVICYPPQFYHLFEKGTNMHVESVYLKCDSSQIIKILDNIKGRILDILLKLEKEFGNLDDLDIDTSEIKEEKLSQIIQNLLVVIQDNSISLGDKNKLKDAKLLSKSRNEEL